MKFIFLFFVVATFIGVEALTAEEKENVDKYFEECHESSKVDIELVKRIKKGDFEFEDNRAKEFILCMFKKTGLMSENGNILKEESLNKLDESIRTEVGRIIDGCLDKKGKTDAETAWNYSKCYEKGRPGQEDFF